MTNTQTTLAAFISAYNCDADDSIVLAAEGLLDSVRGDAREDAVVALLKNGDYTEAQDLVDAEQIGFELYKLDGKLVHEDGTLVGRDAYAMNAGVIIKVGHREECEAAAMECGGDFGWLSNGRMIHRTDFSERE